jgi:hypothetical protein
MKRPPCQGGCGGTARRFAGPLSFCGACFFAYQVAGEEGVEQLVEIDRRRRDRESLLGRVSNLLRRADVCDGEDLVDQLVSRLR